MRNKIILLVIVALGIIYYRGITSISQQRGLNCDFRAAYAICTAKSRSNLPNLIDIFKAGVKF